MCQAAVIDKLYVLGRRVLRLDEEQAGVYLHPVIRGVEPDRPGTSSIMRQNKQARVLSHTVFRMDNFSNSRSLCLNSVV